jgi:hypothetical protein
VIHEISNTLENQQFGFMIGQAERMNPLNSIKYADICRSFNKEYSSFKLFKAFVGQESDLPENIVSIITMNEFENYFKTNFLYDVRFLIEKPCGDDSTLNLTSVSDLQVSKDFKFITFIYEGDRIRIKSDCIESFSVSNFDLKKKTINFIRNNFGSALLTSSFIDLALSIQLEA